MTWSARIMLATFVFSACCQVDADNGLDSVKAYIINEKLGGSTYHYIKNKHFEHYGDAYFVNVFDDSDRFKAFSDLDAYLVYYRTFKDVTWEKPWSKLIILKVNGSFVEINSLERFHELVNEYLRLGMDSYSDLVFLAALYIEVFGGEYLNGVPQAAFAFNWNANDTQTEYKYYTDFDKVGKVGVFHVLFKGEQGGVGVYKVRAQLLDAKLHFSIVSRDVILAEQ